MAARVQDFPVSGLHCFLGVDVGGSKCHALIATEQGEAVGFGAAGAGNWEVVGYNGLARAVGASVRHALRMAGLRRGDVQGAGIGAGGFDWPSQLPAHRRSLAGVGLACPWSVVNDATLGIWAGTADGWGVSVVAGSGCNVRALSRDGLREGRAVGGAGEWSDEWVGGEGIVRHALRSVVAEWACQGERTALSRAFQERYATRDLGELVEGLHRGHFAIDGDDVLLVFRAGAAGDVKALEVIGSAGDRLGEMACGAIRQAGLERESFEVVAIGSLHDGHPLMDERMGARIRSCAPGARIVRLSSPPVVGAVLLAMSVGAIDWRRRRCRLVESLRTLGRPFPSPQASARSADS